MPTPHPPNHPIHNNQPKTHSGDPNAEGQEYFCPSSPGWPPFMRVNPVLDWTYHDVWAFLRVAKVGFCLKRGVWLGAGEGTRTSSVRVKQAAPPLLLTPQTAPNIPKKTPLGKQSNKVAYCSLYDEGYTSLGGVHNTLPNSALKRRDGTFAPAHMLADGRLERSGRATKQVWRVYVGCVVWCWVMLFAFWLLDCFVVCRASF